MYKAAHILWVRPGLTGGSEDQRAAPAPPPPQPGKYRSRLCQWWDVPDLTTWPQVKAPLRVIRSQETWTVRRQASDQVETLTTEWVWATTLPPAQTSTEQAVALGHRRWGIENCAFNELANEWHADHVYKHDPKAIESFLLLSLPGLQPLSRLLASEPETGSSPRQNATLLGTTPDQRALPRGLLR